MATPYPTVFKGNVLVEAGLDTGIYGDGTLAVSVAPTSDFQVATKKYVDDAIAGLDWKEASNYKTVAALSTSVTPAGAKTGKTLTNSGALVALTVDGTAVSVGDRILVDSSGTGGAAGVTDVDNGIYTVTTVGSGAAAWVLTRATDADGSPSHEVDNGMTTLIIGGATEAGNVWTLVSSIDPVDVDVDPQVFVQSGSGATLSWSQVLTTGNTSGANDAIMDSGQIIQGEDAAAAGALTLRGGNASGAAATGGSATLTGGSAGIDGVGGLARIAGSVNNPTVGADAQPAIVTANGGAIDGTGGELSLVAGDSSDQAGDIGGAIVMLGGDTNNSSGTGGDISMTAGIGAVGNASGGDITLTAGGSVGTGTGGSVVVTAGSTVGGTDGTIDLESPVNIATTSLLDLPTTQAPAAVTSLIRVTGVTAPPTIAAPGEGQIAYDEAGNDLYLHEGGGTWSRILSTGGPPTLAEVLVAGNDTGGTSIINSGGDVTIGDNLVVTGTSDLQGTISSSTGSVTVGDAFVVTGTSDLQGTISSSTGDVTIGDAVVVTGTSDLQGTISNSTGSVTVGDAFVVTGASDLQGTISNSTGDVNIGDNVIVTGTSDLQGTISNSTGNVSIGDALDVTGQIDAQGGIIDTTGTLTLSDSVLITGSLDVRGSVFDGAGTLTLADTVSITGALTVASTLTANGNVVIGNTSGDSLTIDAGTTTYVNANTETHNNTYDIVLLDNNAAAWEIGSTGALDMMTFNTTNTTETIEINAQFEMPSGEAVSTTKHFKPTGTTGVPTGDPGSEGHIAYNETGNSLYLHTGGGSWTIIDTGGGTPTLASVLGAGNDTGNTDITNGGVGVGSPVGIADDLSVDGVVQYSTERISVAGAASGSPSMAADTVFITTTAGASAATGTLPDGTLDGRIIRLIMVAKTGTVNYDLTVTNGVDADGGTLSTLSFSKVGHSAELVWGATEGNWYIIGGAGVGTS